MDTEDAKPQVQAFAFLALLTVLRPMKSGSGVFVQHVTSVAYVWIIPIQFATVAENEVFDSRLYKVDPAARTTA